MNHFSRFVESNSQGYLLEEALIRENTDTVILAPHGEQIEVATAAQAEYLSSKLKADYWVLKGFAKNDDGFKEWHTPSTEITKKEFTLLNKLKQEYKLCISFHGMRKQKPLILGGTHEDLKEELLQELASRNIQAGLADPEGPYAGQSDDNIINRLGEGSVQIEQGPQTRKVQGDTISQAVNYIIED